MWWLISDRFPFSSLHCCTTAAQPPSLRSPALVALLSSPLLCPLAMSLSEKVTQAPAGDGSKKAPAPAAAVTSEDTNLDLLEEDDEFEEFPAESQSRCALQQTTGGAHSDHRRCSTAADSSAMEFTRWSALAMARSFAWLCFDGSVPRILGLILSSLCSPLCVLCVCVSRVFQPGLVWMRMARMCNFGETTGAGSDNASIDGAAH